MRLTPGDTPTLTRYVNLGERNPYTAAISAAEAEGDSGLANTLRAKLPRWSDVNPDEVLLLYRAHHTKPRANGHRKPRGKRLPRSKHCQWGDCMRPLIAGEIYWCKSHREQARDEHALREQYLARYGASIGYVLIDGIGWQRA